jgi:hypothetical protein
MGIVQQQDCGRVCLGFSENVKKDWRTPTKGILTARRFYAAKTPQSFFKIADQLLTK